MYSNNQQPDFIGKITFHEQMNVNNKNRNIQTPEVKKVFILHTGGTIGMFPNLEGKFAPAKDQFKQFLTKYPYFCDEDQTYFCSKDDFIITPPSIQDQSIWYKFHQLGKLIDSTNMTFEVYNFILDEIQKVYQNYDAFVILHGTDTMSYTASALSFMIQNLKKPIVFTGAKIPIGQTRNDACNNLLSALTIAGHYSIPQVLLVADNKVLRGNRTNKYSTSSFQLFKTPNFYPIGELGLTVSIKWEKILPCNHQLPTKFVKLSQEVQVIKLTPYGFVTLPQSKYIIVQSFGDGNIPTQGPFYEWALKNSKLPEKQKKIMVNISQVYQSVIKNIYETGEMANKLGMIPGTDMTSQAGIAKLSYLVSKGYTKFEQLHTIMQKNLRGELTEQQDRFMKQKQNYTTNSMILLDRHFQKRSAQDRDILINTIQQTITMQKPSKGALNRLQQFNFDIKKVYPDRSNVLCHLMKQDHHYYQSEEIYALDYLLKEGVDTQIVDDSGNSAVFYAIENCHYEGADKILKKGGVLRVSLKNILKAIKKQNLELLHGLLKLGYNFEQQVDEQGRNCLFYSLLWNKSSVTSFFQDFTNLFDQQSLHKKDLYGLEMKFYVNKFMKNSLICSEDIQIRNSQQNQAS